MCVRDGRIVPSTSFSLAVGMISSAHVFDDILVIVFSSCISDIGLNLLSSGTSLLSSGLYGAMVANLLLMLSILSWKKPANSSARMLSLVASGSGFSSLHPSSDPTS